MITITCNLCPSVIAGENVSEALEFSDQHMATAHPKAVAK